MVLKKFSNVSRNQDITYNLQTVPITISPTEMNVLEITGERINDTVFTLFNKALATTTYIVDNTFGSFTSPIGLAIEPNTQNVFVTDGNTIQVFNSLGSSLFSFGGTGTENGQFQTLQKIRIFNGRLFAMDSTRGLVQVFELDGTYILQFGSTVLSAPFDIAVDSRNNYYVIDNTLGKIFIFNQSFLSKNSITSGLTDPSSIAINSHDTIYITDSTDDNIKIFETNGSLVSTIGTTGTGDLQFDNPINVTVKNNDDVFISDLNNNRIQIINKDGAFLYEIPGVIDSPIGLDFVNDTISVVDSTSNEYAVLSINTTESDPILYKVYGSSNTSTDYSDSNNNQWVNLLSIRDIEKGQSLVYDHNFTISIPIDSRTYESFSNSWKSVLVTCLTTTNNSTLSAFSRGNRS